MKIKIDEQAISELVGLVEDFDRKLANEKNNWEQSRQDRQTISEHNRTISELRIELTALKTWRESADGQKLIELKANLDEREKEITKRRKEIEDLAYNKGYVAGYVEITQKLGKTTP